MKRFIRRPISRVLCGILLLAALALGIYLWRVAAYQRQVKALEIQGLDAEGVSDGVYTGSCDVDFIKARVRVTVRDGKMTEIVLLEHKNGRGQTAESITNTILQAQRTDVDAISGATNSSRVIEKAVENALEAKLPEKETN